MWGELGADSSTASPPPWGPPLFRSGVAATHHKRAVRSELFRGGSRQFVSPGRPAEFPAYCGPIAGPARAGEDRRGPAGMSRLSRSLVRNDACGRALSAAKLQGPAAAQVLFPPQIPGSSGLGHREGDAQWAQTQSAGRQTWEGAGSARW